MRINNFYMHKVEFDQLNRPKVSKQTKKTTSKHKEVELKPIAKKKTVRKKTSPAPVSIEDYADPLKVSPRLATFTLVSVLKNQGLFSQALEVLEALEKKGESPESIALERETIEELVRKLNKE